MVHTTYEGHTVTGPYKEVRKEKDERSSHQHRQQQQTGKDNKHGAWGPVYKNKQHFLDMHIC